MRLGEFLCTHVDYLRWVPNETGEKMEITFFPNWGSNQVCRTQSPTLYRVAKKAGLYRKAVQVCYIPIPGDIYTFNIISLFTINIISIFTLNIITIFALNIITIFMLNITYIYTKYYYNILSTLNITSIFTLIIITIFKLNITILYLILHVLPYYTKYYNHIYT